MCPAVATAECCVWVEKELFPYRRQHPFACIFEDVYDVLEALNSTVVGVGHVVGRDAGAELRHATYLFLRLYAGS